MAAICSDASGDESESSCSLAEAEGFSDGNAIAPEVESQLEHFRKQWHAEIRGRTGGRVRRVSGENRLKVSDSKARKSEKAQTQVESYAQELWLRGADAERKHDLLGAVQCYRKALQLVPDIEMRVNAVQKPLAAENAPKKASVDAKKADKIAAREERRTRIDDDHEHGKLAVDDNDVPLTTRIQRALDECMLTGEPVVQRGECEKQSSVATNTEAETDESTQPSSVLHIGDLPVELLVTILSYVVGPDLDTRSLEQCAAVCRGFYLLSRDDDFWRLICARLFGASNSVRYVLKLSAACWRDVYIQVPHLYFNGVYLSRTSYVRYGEPDFCRQYTPFYLVEYYRCIRFLPDGNVVMVTSAEEPATLVRLLRTANLATLRATRAAGVLCGKYRVAYDEFDGHANEANAHCVKVYMYLSGASPVASSNSAASTGVSTRQFGTNLSNAAKNSFGGKSAAVQCDPPTSFCIELTVDGKHHRRLKWLRYKVVQHSWGTTNASELRITEEMYPAFYFSRVKSFTNESLGCLK